MRYDKDNDFNENVMMCIRKYRVVVGVLAAVFALWGQSAHAENPYIEGGDFGGFVVADGLGEVDQTCAGAESFFSELGYFSYSSDLADGAAEWYCIDDGRDVIFTDDMEFFVPIVIFGDSVVSAESGATVTFTTTFDTIDPPFVYIGGAASVAIDGARFEVNDAIGDYGTFWVLNTSGSVSFAHTTFSDGGTWWSFADPVCGEQFTIEDQIADMQMSLVNVWHDTAGAVTFTDVTFENALIAGLYVAADTTLESVVFADNQVGLVRDDRYAPTMTQTTVSHVSNTLWDVVALDGEIARDGNGDNIAPLPTFVCESALPHAVLSVVRDGSENADHTTTSARIAIDLFDDNGATYTHTALEPLSFALTTTPDTASDEDFTLTATAVEISQDESSAVVDVTIATDALLEAVESFEVAMTVDAAQVLVDDGADRVTVEIVDDAQVAATLAFNDAAEATPTETIVPTVTLSHTNMTGADITVPYTIGGDVMAADYSMDTQTVTIAAGAMSGIGSAVTILDDDLVEGVEELMVTLGAASDARVVSADISESASIADNDYPAFTADVSAVQNGAENPSQDIVFAVTLSEVNPLTETVTFDATFVGGTATPTDDYGASVAGSGVLSIAPGETTATLTVPVVNDPALEGEETVVLNISNPSSAYATIVVNQATATIADDEVLVVAAENTERDKDREDKDDNKKKSSIKAVAAASTATTTPAVAQDSDPTPAAKPTEEEQRAAPVIDEPTREKDESRVITYKKGEDLVSTNTPEVLGVSTGPGDRFNWLIPLIIFLVVLLLLLIYSIYRMVRKDREEQIVRSDREDWWDKFEERAEDGSADVAESEDKSK